MALGMDNKNVMSFMCFMSWADSGSCLFSKHLKMTPYVSSETSSFFVFFFRPFLHISKHFQCPVHMFEFPECSTAYCCSCVFHAQPSRVVFVWFGWKSWSVKSPSQRKFKLPADMSELNLAWGCNKLGSLFSLWCQQNGGCQEVGGLGKVSC